MCGLSAVSLNLTLFLPIVLCSKHSLVPLLPRLWLFLFVSDPCSVYIICVETYSLSNTQEFDFFGFPYTPSMTDIKVEWYSELCVIVDQT